MRLSQKFSPKPEIFNKYNYETQKRIINLIIGDMICFLCFAFLSAAVFSFGFTLVGISMSVVTLLFFVSLITIKSGHAYTGSYIVTGTFLAGTAIIAFCSSKSNELVLYRTACFAVVMATLNSMISLKKSQLVAFHIGSLIILVTSCFTVYLSTFMENKIGTIGALVINVLAIITANFILVANSRLHTKLLKHAEEEHLQVQDSLKTITGALTEANESMNIGQQLNNAANSASQSVFEINDLYTALINDTENLRNQTQEVKEAGDIVNNEASRMSQALTLQNNAILETTSAMEEISVNVSNINIIAQKRRAGLAQVVEILEDQNKLVQRIVEEVKQVHESSEDISKFVKTVNDIAGNTNLLAMNASIEAAHAGTLGKGFSVIAQQIRKLSEETSKNAARIEDTLKINTEIVEKTSTSVTEFASQTENSTKEIEATVDSIEEIIQGISEMDKGAKTMSNELQLVVEKSRDSIKMIENVVNQVNQQNGSLSSISTSTDKLQESVENIKNKLTVINEAIDHIYKDAKTNEEVSTRIASLLN